MKSTIMLAIILSLRVQNSINKTKININKIKNETFDYKINNKEYFIIKI